MAGLEAWHLIYSFLGKQKKEMAMTTSTEQKKRRRGRPKFPEGTTLQAKVGIPMTIAEREEIFEHCEKLGIVTSRWMRKVLLDAIRNGGQQ